MLQNIPDGYAGADEAENYGYLQQGLYSVCKTPKNGKSQPLEGESSFDSGYFSPHVQASLNGQQFTTPQPVYQYSPYKSDHNGRSPARCSSQLLFNEGQNLTPDLQLIDEWDANFINGFQDNLFGFDNIEDSGFVESLLKNSPLKTPVKKILSVSNSPVQLLSTNAIKMESLSSDIYPKYNQADSKQINLLDYSDKENVPFSSNNMQFMSTNQTDIDSNVCVGASQFSYDSKPHLLPVPNRLSDMSSSVPTSVENFGCALVLDQATLQQPYYNDAQYTSIPCYLSNNNLYQVVDTIQHNKVLQPTENYMQTINCKSQRNALLHSRPANACLKTSTEFTEDNKSVCPSKQKLQLARAHFKKSLNRAVESAEARQRKSTKYPQISKALAAPQTRATKDSTDLESLPFERYQVVGAYNAN